jgi:hypothetical protein
MVASKLFVHQLEIEFITANKFAGASTFYI